MIKELEEIFEKYSNNIAIKINGKDISYKELYENSKKIALYLETTYPNENMIAIYMERGIEFITTMLGIILSGKTYIPIDLSFPTKRLEYMIKDTDCKVMISHEKVDFEIIKVEYSYIINNVSSDNYINKIKRDKDNLLYILYTSGSTGEPKGVQIQDKNVLSYIEAFKNEFKISEKDNFLQQSPCTFDISVEEIYPTLFSGATLVIADENIKSNTDNLISYINQNSVTFVSGFPLFIKDLNDNHKKLKTIKVFISGGDTLKIEHVKDLMENNYTVYNTYGPSETTVVVSYYKLEKNKNYKNGIPIGNPIKNTNYIVVNEKGDPISENEKGEIIIYGNGIGSGYINKIDETKKRFLKDSSGKTYFRTGDIAEKINNEFYFLYRNDSQIMVKGKRVELGEIKNKIIQNTGVIDVYIKTNKKNEIVSYLYIDNTFEFELLEKELREYFPKYMIPSYFIINKYDFKRNINGKIEKNDIPEVLNCG